MSFFNFYKKWIKILFNGWEKFLKKTLNFFKELLIIIPFSIWVIYIVSILLLVLVLFPWFTYEIQLNNLQVEYIRSKKWYIFILPSFSTIFFTLLLWNRFYYYLQLFINLFVVAIFLYGFYNRKVHILVQGEYQTIFVFYIYFIVLVFHSFLIQYLKNPKSNIPYYVIQLWNKKKKEIL